MIIFTRGYEQRIIAILKNDNTDPSNFPKRDVIKWDQCAYISNSALNENNQPIGVGDAFKPEYLEYLPSPNPKLYAHVSISPGVNGTTASTNNIVGAPNNFEGSTINIQASIRFGPYLNDAMGEPDSPLLPITDAWIFTISNKDGPFFSIRVPFENGIANIDLKTHGKICGRYFIDEELFKPIYLTNATLVSLGQNMDENENEIPDGNWDVKLIGTPRFDIYESP